MKSEIILSLPTSHLRVGIIEALQLKVKPSSENYKEQIHKDILSLLDEEYVYPDQMQKGIRGLLKGFGFHPSGRNRPASEYLFKDLRNRKEFNHINNVVDINNHISLKYHLPISALDLNKAGYHLCLRLGMENEKYVFNAEGQILSLKKLLLIARNNGAAIGSPVKDSQETKIFTSTENVVFFIYTSANITSEDKLQDILNEFSDLLKKEAEAEYIETRIINSVP
jgi:DNA/RNA-binding domain of Phe-tRNA-synthetase-like protein